MTLYSWVKLLHILSATILLGTGIGIAFFMLKAHLSGNKQAIAVTAHNVVIADWLFTTPAVIIQFTTGLWLTYRLGIPFNSVWFVAVLGLFIFVGLCWVPVVRIQIRIKDLIQNDGRVEDYRRLMRVWILLGIPAFCGVLVLFFLMVSKIGVNQTIIFDFIDLW